MISAIDVDRAIDRVRSARPFERASRMHELLTTGVALRDEAEDLHHWLEREWDNLDALEAKLRNPDLRHHPKRPEYVKHFRQRERVLLAEIQRYTDCQNALGKALKAIGRGGT